MASIKEIESDFKRLIKNEALNHAYVFYGPCLSDQFALAKRVANFLEKGAWEDPVTQLSEARFIDGEGQHLGVELAREFNDFLFRHPVTSQRRVLVINSAAELTVPAQNAILKLVEEPPKHALILLTVRDINSLLAPLKSRLQMFYVSQEAGSAQKKTPHEERAVEIVEKFLIAGADGRKLIIKKMVDDDKEDGVEKSQKIVDTFISCLVAELAKKPEKNSILLREVLKRQTAMADFSTNKKLQLEALLQYM